MNPHEDAECEGLRKDAERYRWLREYNLDAPDNAELFGIRRDELDASIDAARKP